MIPPRVHFVGIGGIGMSALARVLLADGHTVSGSDLELSPLTRALEAEGATVTQGHRAGNVPETDLVVISSAVRGSNPEVAEAARRGIPVIKRAELVGEVMATRFGIAVAGTHGKTTTTSLVAVLLEEAGLDPTILSGGVIPELGTNAKRGFGEHIVVEADEYDGSFLRFHPKLAVLTNVEADHLDFYPTLDAIVEAFRTFLARLPAGGLLVACGDDAIARSLSGERRDLRVIRYGYGADNDWRIVDRRPLADGTVEFAVRGTDTPAGTFNSRLPGLHNVLNVTAALAVAGELGIDWDVARRVVARFGGARRRFELKGMREGITVIDDYGHHPTEIRATLQAAKERFPGRRLIVIFQAHTYTRTKNLLYEFGESFGDADQVLVTDIYAARETDDLGVHARDLAERISDTEAAYSGDLTETEATLRRTARPGDVVLTVGAGNVYRVAEQFLGEGKDAE